MLAIAGGKGGCGKTTTALGLAAAAAPAVVADLDRDMPDLHALAGVPREPTLADAGAQPATAGRPLPGEPEVSVLPAPPPDADVTGALARLEGGQPPVLLDCPAGAGPDAAAPLDAAGEVLLVSTACAPALRDAAKTAAMARQLDARVVGAVLTRTRLEPDGVERLLGCPVLASVPAVEPPVLEAAVVRAAYGRLADGLRAEDVL